ncbi:unnamed protein product [Heligmosomoides polygyrus]|uniref:Reverse transcriptase domain-containing protein n=1 Tax=Heligmosomoides polygyrus TaxID=6339 RepID=A0A183GB57_HELPZ|nr:unnamed protein product [Heligmosomoides polygyrus]
MAGPRYPQDSVAGLRDRSSGKHDDLDLEHEGQYCELHELCPIRLLSYSMMIIKRLNVFDIVELFINQCGFVVGCGTIDGVRAARLLVERHRKKQKPIHLAFLDFSAFLKSLLSGCAYLILVKSRV